MAPDPWQRLVLDDWLSENGGKWAALTCGLAVPRQNGKNGVLEIRELFGMVGRGEKILHTAHEVKTAQKHFRRLKFFFGSKADDPGAKFPELNALVREVRNVNGQEGIFLTNGGSVELVARSKNSGRGFTVDVLVMDEAQEMSEDALEALMPTTSSAPSGNPQWIFTGTPPGPFANGEVFKRVRREALSGKSKRLSWDEWSIADRSVSLSDKKAWFDTNPALNLRRSNGTFALQFEVIEGEQARFSPDGFARERLGWWVEDSATSSVFPAGAWEAGIDASSRMAEGARVFCVDVSWDRSMSYIAVAGLRSDGAAHVEMAAQRAGTEWVVPWLTEPKRVERRGGRVTVVLQARGAPVSSLLDELKSHPELEVVEWQGSDIGAASGVLYDAVAAWVEPDEPVEDVGVDVQVKPVRHPPWPALDLAAASAVTKPFGDGWGWDRRKSPTDASPLVAATGAVWHALKKSAPPVRSAYEDHGLMVV